jgi:uncharacterized membrane protein
MSTSDSNWKQSGSIALWVILGLYLLSGLRPEGMLSSLDFIVGLLPVVFALWHLIRWAGVSTALLSFAVIVVTSWSFEAVGVATGRVFGDYYYPPDLLGPLLVGVPPLVMLQYFAMGYSALVMARAIGGTLWVRAAGVRLVVTSAMAALAMVVLDLSSDPMQSTVHGDWIWRTGGAYFGVPIQNFWGWFITTFTFFVIVQVLFLRRTARAHLEIRRPDWFYLQGALLYAGFWLPIVLRPLLGDESEIALAMSGVGGFAMSIPLVASALSIYRPKARV